MLRVSDRLAQLAGWVAKCNDGECKAESWMSDTIMELATQLIAQQVALQA